MTGGRSNIDSTSGDSYSAGVVASLLSSHVIGCTWCAGFQFSLCYDSTVTGTRGLYHDVHIGTQRQHHLKNHNCKQHGCREQERIRALIQIVIVISTPTDKSYDYKLVIATTVNHRRSGITRSTTDRSSIAESTATSPPMGRTFLVQ